MWRKLVPVFAICVFFLAGNTFLLAGDCSIKAPCCSATADECAENQVCACSFVCGRGWHACSCACEDPARIRREEPNLDARVEPDEDVGMSLSGADLDLDRVAALLQDRFDWYVQVDSGVRGRPVGDLDYSGTFAGLLDTVAARTGTSWHLDDRNGTITFSE